MKRTLNVSFLIFNALYVALICCVFNLRNLLVPSSMEIGPQASTFAVFYGLIHFFWFSFLITFFVSFVLRLIKTPKLILPAVALFNGLLLSYVLADTFVWNQFRLHLNIAMLQMTFLGGGQIVPLSGKEIVEITILVFLCLIGGGFIAWLGKRTGIKSGHGLIVGGCLVVASIATTIVYGWSFARENNEYLVAADVVPIRAPITFNTFLLNNGILSKKEFLKGIATAHLADSMKYPLNPLDCKGGEPLNIVILGIDSLRADELTPEIMPNTWKFAQKAIRFTDHWSGGIATKTGVFSLFTSLPASYWNAALYSKTPSILVQALKERGYEIGTFTGAPLDHPEFDQTIFSGVENLQIKSYGHNVLDRDRYAEDEFKYWAQRIPKDKNFFAFIFLDNVHSHAFPETPEFTFFEPYLEEVEYLKLPFTDKDAFFNRNKNAAHYADEAVGRIIQYLERKHLLEKTVLIITSDHGNEFNDNGQNFWEHNGNFTKYQAQVPLVIWWPGKKPEIINYRTSALDIVPTLLPEILGCKNPISDYSVGRSLWNSNPRPFVYCSTYGKDAFIEPNRTIVIDEQGLMNFVDNRNRQSSDRSIPSYLKEAINDKSRFLKK